MGVREYKLRLALDSIETIEKELDRLISRINNIKVDVQESKDNIDEYIKLHKM